MCAIVRGMHAHTWSSVWKHIFTKIGRKQRVQQADRRWYGADFFLYDLVCSKLWADTNGSKETFMASFLLMICSMICSMLRNARIRVMLFDIFCSFATIKFIHWVLLTWGKEAWGILHFTAVLLNSIKPSLLFFNFVLSLSDFYKRLYLWFKQYLFTGRYNSYNIHVQDSTLWSANLFKQPALVLTKVAV